MLGKNTAEYKSWIARKKYMDNMPYHLKVVNTGSTAGYKAFDYQYWKEAGFNLGWQPQTLFYDFETLKKYGNHLAKGARIYICIEEFKLLVNHYPDPSAALKYYFFLDPEQIHGYDSKFDEKLRVAPCLVKKNLFRSEITSIIKKMLRYKTPIPTFKTLEEKDRYYSNYYLAMWNREFGWVAEKPNLSENQVKSIEVNTERLKQMLLYCVAQGWKPIVVIVPFSPNISDRLPDNILNECLWRPLEKIKEYGYTVLDLFHDDRLHDYRLYEDGISLNEKGKKIFNEIIQELSRGDDARENKDMFEEKKREDKKVYRLRNDLNIPWISFGTGVIWKYSRNKILFLKVNVREALSSVKHLKLNRELKGNLQIKRILKDAYDSGFRMFDSGRIYAYSEASIGKTISEYQDVMVTTKCSAMDITRNCSPDNVEGNIKISMKNLNTEKIDLYMLHWPEGDWLNYYAQVVEQYKNGRCKAFGACNLNIDHLKQIEQSGLELPMVMQTELHPLNSKKELREYCRTHEIQLMAHTPTARYHELLINSEVIKALMRKYNKSAVQIVMRWHYQNQIIPVVSTFNKKHMCENQQIFDFYLQDDEMNEIEELNQDYVVLNAVGIDDPNYIYND